MANQAQGISLFFAKTLGAPLANVRWSWGALKPTTGQIFLRVWDDEFDRRAKRVHILGRGWKTQSPGRFERQSQIAAIKTGAESYGIACIAKDAKTTGPREIKSFDSKNLLCFGKLVEEGDDTYATILGEVSVRNIRRRGAYQTDLRADLAELDARNIKATAREALALARIGQGTFRVSVLRIWENRCCVTGAGTRDAIRASHIKPWRDCNDRERLDPYNGLPLLATPDALFDSGLISFRDDGGLMISKSLIESEVALMGLSDLAVRKSFHKRTAIYLAHHRRCIFIDGAD